MYITFYYNVHVEKLDGVALLTTHPPKTCSTTLHFLTEFSHWLIQSLSRNVCVCVCLCVCHFFCLFFKRLNTLIYKGEKSNRPIAKIFFGEKLRKDMVKNCSAFLLFLLVLATQCPGLSLVHGRSASIIELKNRGRRASTIELKRRGCSCSIR